jgi:sterol desaturase/sphingolipid hydroxylase (fatty acid hydroxylase superfamily)
MHHSDVDIDTSTGIRFHPIEIFISMAIKMTAIVILGAAPIAVLIFEILLNATSLFNHGNVFITNRLDRILRWIVVTPEMHRVHHSTDKIERNRNFGFNFPYWDYLFGTYRDQPALGHDRMMIGLNAFRELSDHTLQRLLLQPFKKS